jgi:hypothetical protein
MSLLTLFQQNLETPASPPPPYTGPTTVVTAPAPTTPVGSASDIISRIKAVLPPWFADSNPILNALLAAFGSAWSFVYSLYAYAQLQTRILTATDGWLDLIAQDFFGTSLRRTVNQSDANFRALIIANMFRPRDTRPAISELLRDLTGYTPVIIEPFVPSDCGVYGRGYAGYGAAGAYGSQSIPAQAFIIAYRPAQEGIAIVAGYGISTAGYGSPSQGEYASLSTIPDTISDAAIYAAIDATKAAGTQMWVCITNKWIPEPFTIDGAGLTIDGHSLTFS